MKITINIVYIICPLLLLGYVSGMWVPKKDGWDSLVLSIAVASALPGWGLLNFGLKYLEDKGSQQS